MRATPLLLVVATLSGCLGGTSQPPLEVLVTTRYDASYTEPADAHGAPPAGSGAANGLVLVHWVDAERLEEWRNIRDSGLFDPVAPLRHPAGAFLLDNATNRARLHVFPLDDEGGVTFRLVTSRDLVLSATPEGNGGTRNGCRVQYEAWGERDRQWFDTALREETHLEVPFGVSCSAHASNG